MESDVKATTLTSSGAVFAGPGRVKGIYIVDGASAGSIILRDGGSGGTAVCTLNTPGTATGHQDLIFPGNGLRCETDIYCTISNATSVTVFYA